LNYDELDKNTIPFGTMVLADGEEKLDATIFYSAQIIGTHHDGRYEVYHLSDGSFALLDRKKVVPLLDASFLSPADAKMFSTCTDFEEFLFENGFVSPFSADSNTTNIFRREVGDGCIVTVSSTQKDDGGDDTTIIATYDGQKHLDLNIYSTDHSSLMIRLAEQDIPGMQRTQTDSHPRGYGRVISFQEDLNKAYFGTKYPRSIF